MSMSMSMTASAPPLIAALVADLDAAERGFLLGLMQSAGTVDITAALRNPSRDRCTAAAAAIADLTRAERARLTSLLAAEALAPIPSGIENVHPDTLRRLLETQSTETIHLIAADAPAALRAACVTALAERDDGPLGPETATALPDAVGELQRAVLAPIVAVPPAVPGGPSRRWALRLAAMAPSELRARLTAAGADLLGVSLRGADDTTLKRAAAHVEAPWSERIVASAHAPSDTAEANTAEAEADTGIDRTIDRTIDRARARDLVAATAPDRDPRATLDRLGARALGHRLGRSDPDLALAIAQRLPAELGQELLAASEV
jgi:hypothetical protein